MRTAQSTGMRLSVAGMAAAGLVAAHTAFGGCQVETSKGADGKTRLLLENEYLRVTLDPDLGGQCTGIAVKSDAGWRDDFVVNLFDDMDWNKQFDDQCFSRKPYTFQILEQTAKRAKVLLEARGSGEWNFIAVRKTVELNAGERLFTTGYEVHNLFESMGTFTFRLSCHNGFYPKGKNAVYFWSSPQGIATKEFASHPGNYWELQPARGWEGIVSQSEGSGAACVLDYTNLFATLVWLGGDSANMEWRYAPARIKNGESFQTAVTVIPFAGLKGLDHANRYAAFRFNLPEDAKPGDQRIALDIASGIAKEIKLTVEYRKVSDTNWSKVEAKSLKLSPKEGVQALPFALPALTEGRYVLRASLESDGGVDSFERVLTVGAPADRGEYAYKPLERRNEGAKSKDFFPFKPSEAVVTPHVEWFKPYAGGKPKVLFIQDCIHVRTIIELAQRLSMDYEVPVLKQGSWGFIGFIPPISEETGEGVDGKPYFEALEKTLCGEAQYDVIVFGAKILWKDLTAKSKQAVQDRIKAGAVVMIGNEVLKDTGLSAMLKAGEPFPSKPDAWRDWNFFPCNVGAGGVLTTGGKALFSHEFIRGLLWAAKMAPKTVVEFAPTKARVDRADLHGQGIALNVNSPVAGKLTIETVFTDGTLTFDDHTAWQGSQLVDVKPGENAIVLAVTNLPVGAYTVGAIVKQGTSVLNSAIRKIEVTDPLAIAVVTVDKDVCRSSDPVVGTASLTNSGTAEATNLACVVEFADNWGRLLAKSSQSVQVAPGQTVKVPFTFLQPQPLSVIHAVTVRLLQGQDVVATTNLEVTFPEQAYRDDDYLAFTWPGCDGSVWGGWTKYGSPILRDACGFNLEMTYSGKDSTGRNVKYYSFGLLGEAYNDWQNCKERGIRKNCFNDPAVQARFGKDAEKRAAEGARYGWFALNVGDEVSLTHWECPSEICFCPLCKAGFSEWIKAKYPGLEALNAEWATDFKDWSQVAPMIESEAKDRANLAPWSDYRTYMQDVYTGFFRKMRAASVDKTPGARFSVCGVQPGHPYSGYDWWKLRDVFDFVMPYFSTASLRSFNDHGKYGRYTGYRITPEQQRKDCWSFFFEGQFVFSYFVAELPLLPDYTISHLYADPIRENSDRFERGIGKLFIRTQRQSDRIAIHLSQSSINVNYMLQYREGAAKNFLRFYRTEVASLECVLKDLGYDPLYVSNEEIETGKLTPDRFRMLILPLSTALSSKEAENIRQYVAAGGSVVADGLTGLYDEHGKPSANGKGSLDDLFGIERTQGASDRLAYQPCKFDGSPQEAMLIVESGVSPKGSTPVLNMAGKIESKVNGFVLAEPARAGSAAFLKTSGKGRTVYLAFASEYFSNPALSPVLAPIFKKVFDAAGVPEPEIKVQNADGHPALCQVLRHRYGDSPALFVGFLERDGLPVDGKPRQVTLPGEFHVYDLLKGGLVKAGSSFEFTPIPGLGNLYAALPYAVQGLEAACPAKAKVGESLPFTLTVAVSGGKPGYHVLRRVVVNPEGKEEPCYSANLEAPDGVCTGRLDLALNAMPGRWTLKARDVLTGNETQRSFEVAR